MIPGKRRRKRKDPGLVDNAFIDDSVRSAPKSSSSFRDTFDRDKRREEEKKSADKTRKEEEARRKRLHNAKKAPPPVDFQSLLKMANEKKDIPIKVDKKAFKKESEFGDRPMGKQEKEDYMRENEARLRKEGKWKEKTPPPKRIERIERKPLSLPEEKPRYEKPKPRPEPGPMYHAAVKK